MWLIIAIIDCFTRICFMAVIAWSTLTERSSTIDDCKQEKFEDEQDDG
jgi:hypothetical protein